MDLKLAGCGLWGPHMVQRGLSCLQHKAQAPSPLDEHPWQTLPFGCGPHMGCAGLQGEGSSEQWMAPCCELVHDGWPHAMTVLER